MSDVHINHIRSAIEKSILPSLDTSDITRDPDKTNALSRGLAAYILSIKSGIDPSSACLHTIDGFKDNGIDAIHYDTNEKVLYIIQSKWNNQGNKSPQVGDVQKFIQGVKDVLTTKFDKFNDKFQLIKPEIVAALSDAKCKIELIVSYTGTQPLSSEARECLNQYVDELNDPTQVAYFNSLNQQDIHRLVKYQTDSLTIPIEVMLYHWGQVKEPYEALYGCIHAQEVANWYADHGPNLFDKNLRRFIGSTEVNDNIQSTLEKENVNFWYYNNGITIICNSFTKKPIGGSDRSTGSFVVEGVSVVNGAQTVGSIYNSYLKNPACLENAKVFVRFISLTGTPDGFGLRVTRATNTQNKVERKDFAALDPQQERIFQELEIDGWKYVYKSGETLASSNKAFDLEEATVALACNEKDISYAVQAKREIGRLWEDTSKEPYTRLFNQTTTGAKIRNLVMTNRCIEDASSPRRKNITDREVNVLIHGNRLIQYCVFKKLSDIDFKSGMFDLEKIKPRIISATNEIASHLKAIVENEYSNTYLTSLFKNNSKCKEIAQKILSDDPSQQEVRQYLLFDETPQ